MSTVPGYILFLQEVSTSWAWRCIPVIPVQPVFPAEGGEMDGFWTNLDYIARP
jgi:hypothetical protein